MNEKGREPTDDGTIRTLRFRPNGKDREKRREEATI